jgi:hypothetical protein
VSLDPNVQALLLERLGGQAGADGRMDALVSALASQAGDDPVMGAVLSSVLSRQALEAEEQPDEHEACQRELDRSRRAIRRLRELLAPANEIAVYVAEVFGACSLCWGLDETCRRCGGKGRAGWREPLEEEFLSWAGPAALRLGLRLIPQSSGDEISAPRSEGSDHGNRSRQ